jgi:hypothetical protein
MPLRRVILHIGRHKSGTSSLQHCLGRNRPALNRQHVLFPRSGTTNGVAHHALAQAINPRITEPHVLGEMTEAIKAEVKPHHRTLLVSSEAFQNVRKLSRMQQFLADIGPVEVVVIAYLREHLDYAMSSFRQMVQNQTKFSTFAEHARGFRDVGRFLDRWADVGTLKAKWFDRKMFEGGDVIRDFCAETGLELDYVPDRDMNPSIGGNLLVYKLAANKLGLSALSYGELKKLAESHPPFRAPFYISDEDAAHLRRTDTYNSILLSRMGEVTMKSFAHHAPLPELNTLDEDLARIAAVTDIDPRLKDEMRQAATWFRVTD